MIDTITLLETINLYDLISRDTEEAKGGRLWCVFCQPGGSANNNSPAMSVKGRSYHCFGCGSSGDAIDYIMQRDNVDFREAYGRLGWDGKEPDLIEVNRRIAERKKAQELETDRRAKELDELLAEYSSEEIWEAYSRRLTEEHRAWWRSRGILDDWQNYLLLGFIPDKIYRGKDGKLAHSPAYTIPYFHSIHKFQTIQYRLHNPDRPQDRYRFEHGLKATYYQVDQDHEIGEQAFICEGAIKSIVTSIYCNDNDEFTLLAIPSKETFGSIQEAIKNCERVWICLDPDCWKRPVNAAADWLPAPIKLSRLIGPTARVIELPDKIDDLILRHKLNGDWIKKTMRQAVKL